MVNMQKVPGRYTALDNGPGCGDRSLDKDECAKAAKTLGYTDVVTEGSWGHQPYGCLVGHPSDNWIMTYFNNQHGQTGRNVYKSICLASTYFI